MSPSDDPIVQDSASVPPCASGTSSIIASDIAELLSRTAPLWRELADARLFITGGTGFFGTWLLEAIVAANRRFGLGCRVTALSRDPTRFATRAPHLAADPAVTFLAGDVRDFAFPEGPVTHVIHAATDVAPPAGPANPRDTLETCVAGTRRVVACARTTGARRFLLVSSGAVYGRQPAELSHIPEDFPGDAARPADLDAYAAGKRAAEAICLEAAQDGPPTQRLPHLSVARGFAFVGPGLPLDAHFAIGNFIRDVINGGPVTIRGDGSALRSYLYAADMAEWLITILVRGRNATSYNVGAEEALSMRQLAIEVVDVARECLPRDVRPDIVVQSIVPASATAHRLVPCCRRAREQLGLSATVVRREAIRRTMLHAIGRPSISVPHSPAG